MLKGAIIGFGEVAEHGHWPAYAASREAKIVAIVDLAEERRAIGKQLLPALPVFASLEEIPESLPLEFVDICTPPAFHADSILKALERGLHVLCEKPLLVDPEELERVRQRSSEAGRCVLPVHNWKYAPIIRQASEALLSGAIGVLRVVEIETMRVRDCTAADPDRPNWRRDPSIAGGGILMDHGWHAIYLALHWFRENPFDSEASLHRPTPTEVEDEATLTIQFPSGKATVALTWNGDSRRNFVRLIGERGKIVIDDDTLEVSGKVERFDEPLSRGSYHAEWFAAMLPDVIASFRNPSVAKASFDEAAICLSLIHQAYQTDLARTLAQTIKSSS